jgi:radical SAM superfamily enzyme YgiQ (UPF0313 family)
MRAGRHAIRSIALVEPKGETVTVYSGIRIPRQGVVLLGTILAERGYEVEVQVEEVQALDRSALVEADLVGISLITPTAPRGYALADSLRRMGIPVVLGGYHPTFLPDEGLSHADFVVRGEGEDTLVELVEALNGHGDLSAVRGLSFHEGRERVHNPARDLECNLERFPIPDFSLVRGMRRGNVATVLTRRGCPFDCSFCCVAPFNEHRVREVSVERVLAEVERQLPWVAGRGMLFFADDIFNLHPSRMKAILRGMIEHHLTPLWVAQVRHEAARDPELLDLMRRSNCGRVCVGFESVNAQTLVSYGKQETRAEVVATIAAFHRANIKVHGMFVLGSDEDTVATVYETCRFAIEHDLDSMQMNILTPLPGSRLFTETAQEPHRRLPASWAQYDGGHAVHVPKRISPAELQEHVTTALLRFYSLGRAFRRLVERDAAEAAIRLFGWWLTHRAARDFRAHARWLRSLTEPARDGLDQGVVGRQRRPSRGERGGEKPPRPAQGVLGRWVHALGRTVAWGLSAVRSRSPVRLAYFLHGRRRLHA